MPIDNLVSSEECAALGLSVAFLAGSAFSWVKYLASSATIRRIRHAPSARVSDLRSIIDSHDDGDGKLVVVRGQVQATSTVVSSCIGLKHSGALVSQRSNHLAVVVLQTQKYLYNKSWRNCRRSFSLEILDLLLPIKKSGQCLSSLRRVPFLLVEGGQQCHPAYVHVRLDGSTHPLPLTTVYHQIYSPWYSFIWTILGGRCPVSLMNEESILAVGKTVTAVGICSEKEGALEIKCCMQLPCFLSDMTKEEIEADLTFNSKILFWSSVVLGMVSISTLGYVIIRRWRRREELKKNSRNQVEPPSTGNSEGLRDGELCVICLARQRVRAFVPCGHRICCQRCAAAVITKSPSPKCPVCRQLIDSSMRIYDF